jgi:hypothetical protein
VKEFITFDEFFEARFNLLGRGGIALGAESLPHFKWEMSAALKTAYSAAFNGD